jgi:hypothetical protein
MRKSAELVDERVKTVQRKQERVHYHPASLSLLHDWMDAAITAATFDEFVAILRQ